MAIITGIVRIDKTLTKAVTFEATAAKEQTDHLFDLAKRYV